MHVSYLSDLFYEGVENLAADYVKNLSAPSDVNVFLTVLDIAGITAQDLIDAGNEAGAVEASNKILREAIVNY